jgi:hypothetical protein
MADGTATTGTTGTAAAAPPPPLVIFTLMEITATDGTKTYHPTSANPLTEDQVTALEVAVKAALARPSYAKENARLLEERKGFIQQVQELQLQVQDLQAQNTALKGGGAQ